MSALMADTNARVIIFAVTYRLQADIINVALLATPAAPVGFHVADFLCGKFTIRRVMLQLQMYKENILT